MAVKKTIELEVEVGDLKKNLEAIQKEFEEIKGSIKGVEKQSKKQANATAKGFKKLQGAANKVRKGISGIGLAFKLIPIAAALEAFRFLGDAFQSNREAADAFATVTGTVQKVLRDFIDLIVDNFDNVVNFFKEPLKSIKDFGQAIIDSVKQPLAEALEGLKFFGKAALKILSLDFAGAAAEAA